MSTPERQASERQASERQAPQRPAPEFPAPEFPAPEFPAYDDRLAWIMACLSRLAYDQFATERQIDEVAEAMAGLLGIADGDDDGFRIPDDLKALATALADANKTYDDRLQAALERSGYRLKGVFESGETETHGFVAVRDASEVGASGAGDDFHGVVVSFRGTEFSAGNRESILIDLEFDPHPVRIEDPVSGGTRTLGFVHRGFFDAFFSVEAPLRKILDALDDDEKKLPLYLTGHSLGGALATLGTLFLSDVRQRACYTFGGPPVGDVCLIQHYGAPVYKVVNAADPVVRAGFLIFFRYVHFGPLRRFSGAAPGPRGDYPGLTLSFGDYDPSAGPIRRLISRFRFLLPLRILAFFLRIAMTLEDHRMRGYLGKLRAYAIHRRGTRIRADAFIRPAESGRAGRG